MTPRRAAPRSLLLQLAAVVCLPLVACGGALDAGSDLPREGLPVSALNPIILTNDGAYDNWHGEYAVLLAHTGGPPLAGIVVGAGGMWSDLDANFSGWQEFVTRARASGLSDVPDPIRSASTPLSKPDDGQIESTVPNGSEGARFIVDTSARLSRPDRPVVVATGGHLTDVADAYLMDPSVADRVIVVSSLGTGFSDDTPLARMGVPNGELDPWAAAIVVQRFRYVQVSAYYDQLTDLPPEQSANLPDNPLGAWIRDKQAEILKTWMASDQVSVIALGIPEFTLKVTRASLSGYESGEPVLLPDADGRAWIVDASDGTAATARLWQVLTDPLTFEH